MFRVILGLVFLWGNSGFSQIAGVASSAEERVRTEMARLEAELDTLDARSDSLPRLKHLIWAAVQLVDLPEIEERRFELVRGAAAKIGEVITDREEFDEEVQRAFDPDSSVVALWKPDSFAAQYFKRDALSEEPIHMPSTSFRGIAGTGYRGTLAPIEEALGGIKAVINRFSDRVLEDPKSPDPIIQIVNSIRSHTGRYEERKALKRVARQIFDLYLFFRTSPTLNHRFRASKILFTVREKKIHHFLDVGQGVRIAYVEISTTYDPYQSVRNTVGSTVFAVLGFGRDWDEKKDLDETRLITLYRLLNVRTAEPDKLDEARANALVAYETTLDAYRKAARAEPDRLEELKEELEPLKEAVEAVTGIERRPIEFIDR